MIKAKSSFLILFFNLKLDHVLTPWMIEVDMIQEQIIVRKRNWYLIGINESTIAFRYIRKIHIDQHLFGANIHIQVIGTRISAQYLPKKAVKEIRDLLFSYNQRHKKAIL